jgi:phosphoglycolate phosphatase-like HAD superfamily hydrolase
MRILSERYFRARLQFPDDELCIVFDIDGTILDLRHLIVHVLIDYDRLHGCQHFRGLVADDIKHHEDDVERVLESLAVPPAARPGIVEFYRTHLWDRGAILAASKPYEGVFGVIRWFQLQPRTHVALNTGRGHHLRDDTLESLNTVGAAYRVWFEPELLFTADGTTDIPSNKVSAIDELTGRGMRVVAVIDNEPDNLRAMALADVQEEILFLHADTIFRSQRLDHDRSVAGQAYRLRDLVPDRELPSRVEFVWHGVNDGSNLDRFLGSEVRWAEVDVRRDPVGRLVLRHDGFDEAPWRREERSLLAEETVRTLTHEGRSVKLDLKEGGQTLADVLSLIQDIGIDDERVWFNAELPVLGRSNFESLRRRFPRSTISAPVGFITPLMLASEEATDHTLNLLRSWGVSRLSLRWKPLANAGQLIGDLEAQGWQINLYDIPDLESFLEASLQRPASITADFNFPEWRYHGRGSGAKGGLLGVD